MADVVEKQTEEAVKETLAAEEKTKETETAKEGTEANGVALSENEKKIIQQVEYYFGDANLSRDKFLRVQIGKDEEGWVPVSVIITFKRLASISTDSNVVVDALMKSESGLIEISKDRLKIRRHPEKPLPERSQERRKEIMSRTAYVKGFPLDADIDVLLKYFADFEKVSQVSRRIYFDKPTNTNKFKGSVFVTFETKEFAENFIEKTQPEYENNKLIVKWQEKYLDEKRQEKILKFNTKKEKKVKEVVVNKFVLPKRSVVRFEGCNEEVTRELIRPAVEKVSSDFEIAYIDFSKGDKEGHVRFTQEDTAAKFLDKLEDKKLQLNDNISLDVHILTEEEENEFLERAVESMKSRRNHFKKCGGHHRKRRGGNGDCDEEKKAKVDEKDA